MEKSAHQRIAQVLSWNFYFILFFWLGSGYADLLKSVPKGRQGVTFHNISVQCFHCLQTFCSPPGQEGRWLSGDQEGSSEESEERHFLHCRAFLREHAERKIAAEKQKLRADFKNCVLDLLH